MIQEIKQKMLSGEAVTLANESNVINLFLGHQNRFCLEFNCKVILSTKTFKPIQNKLEQLNLDTYFTL